MTAPLQGTLTLFRHFYCLREKPPRSPEVSRQLSYHALQWRTLSPEKAKRADLKLDEAEMGLECRADSTPPHLRGPRTPNS